MTASAIDTEPSLGRGVRHFFAFRQRRRRHQKDRDNGWMEEVNLALGDEGNVNPRVGGKEKAMTGTVRITELDGLSENFAY